MGLAVGHPLDTLKVRQQTIPGGGGIMELAKSTYKIEGVSTNFFDFNVVWFYFSLLG